jgi:hypothetical protein
MDRGRWGQRFKHGELGRRHQRNVTFPTLHNEPVRSIKSWASYAGIRMMKRLFLTLCLATATSAGLHASEPSIRISLGLRDAKSLQTTNVPFPLAFRIENTGKTVIGADQVPELFRKGIVHLSATGQQQRERSLEFFGMVWPVQPGAMFEHGWVANILTLFPLTKDGVYQVWWTVGDCKSNVLRFTVASGKIQLIKPEAQPDGSRQRRDGASAAFPTLRARRA